MRQRERERERWRNKITSTAAEAEATFFHSNCRLDRIQEKLGGKELGH